jgi:hypothetical protein
MTRIWQQFIRVSSDEEDGDRDTSRASAHSERAKATDSNIKPSNDVYNIANTVLDHRNSQVNEDDDV